MKWILAREEGVYWMYTTDERDEKHPCYASLHYFLLARIMSVRKKLYF